MTAVELTTPHIGRFPIVLPSVRDPRLHTAAVIISIHIIGITALGFRVSVPQIVSAILTAAGVDLAVTLRQSGKLVWPASGMLTGSGVALILRLVDMPAGDYWTWRGWHYYAAIAGGSVLTKHVIRRRGSHLFNPSNVGLVGAFLLLGREVVEPLDFWWAPFDEWMALAYLIVLTGGILITRRLALLEMAVTFWVVLAAGLGLLAGSGHCMVAAWSPEPVCDAAFWWVLVASPEVLIFLLFMITDPKTIPTGRWARVAFAAALAALAVILMAPSTTEYGAKVGLLASLVVLSPLRALFDRYLPRLSYRGTVTPRRAFLQGMGIGWAMAVLSFGIVFAGLPARDGVRAMPTAAAPDVEVYAASLPEVSVEPGVSALNVVVDPAQVALTLAQNLAVEARAVEEGDSSLLTGVATGDRLAEMQRRVSDAVSTGRRPVSRYSFESLVLGVAEAGEGQASASLSLTATGTETVVTYDAFGREMSSSDGPFQATFTLRRVGGERWLISSVDS